MRGFVVVALVLGRAATAQKLREQYPWYHTASEIHSEIADLANNCPNAQLELSSKAAVNGGAHAGEQVTLDVVKVSKGGDAGKKKAVFVFGEHARELISPETSLKFLKTLCGKGSSLTEDLVERVLATTSFVVVPNANPLGRQKVEEGQYCKRTNEDAVDLNRNWGDSHRDSKRANTDDEMNPGPYGFSEPETIALRSLLSEEKPDIFLSVHSGAYFLGTPFGYTDQRVADNEDQMENVLRPISDRFCQGGCPFGGLAEMIGYKSIGCDIDWVKENLNTPYAFTWEIYIGSSARKFYVEEARARAENREMNDDAKEFFFGNGLNLLEMGHRRLRGRTHARTPESEEHPDDCFEQFNPQDQSETEEVTENWTGAFLTLCDKIAAGGSAGGSAASTPTDPAAASAQPTQLAPSQAPDPFVATVAKTFSAGAPQVTDPFAVTEANTEAKTEAAAPAAPIAPIAPAAPPKTQTDATMLSTMEALRQFDSSWRTSGNFSAWR